MSSASLAAWVRWRTRIGGAEPGTIERLPRAVAEVFIERGDADEVEERAVPPDVRRRGISR